MVKSVRHSLLQPPPGFYPENEEKDEEEEEEKAMTTKKKKKKKKKQGKKKNRRRKLRYDTQQTRAAGNGHISLFIEKAQSGTKNMKKMCSTSI